MKSLVNKTPTAGQKKAGNYKKAHVAHDGLALTIENPQGSTRSGVDKNGQAWSTTMQDHYGYIKGVLGKDKDHLDMFLNPTPVAGAPVFVIDQLDPSTGLFDEHKVMIGYPSQDAAIQGYLGNYDPSWMGLGHITQMSMDQFKQTVEKGTLTDPIAIRKRNSLYKAMDFLAKAYYLLKPFANEHAARLQDPGKFDPETYRRTRGSGKGKVWGVKVPSTIDVIWGKLKDGSGPVPQTLRFPLTDWTPEAAKKWLSDNNIKPMSFEPSKNKEEKSMIKINPVNLDKAAKMIDEMIKGGPGSGALSCRFRQEPQAGSQ